MTIESKRSTVIRLAREVGLCTWVTPPDERVAEWERFFDGAAKEIILMREIELMSQRVDAVAAVAAEREACAQVAEDGDHEVEGRGYYMQGGDARATMRNIAAAIRARGAS